MAEEYVVPKTHECEAPVVREEVVEGVEVKDRGIFDFGKKDGEEKEKEHGHGHHDHDHRRHHEQGVKEEVIVAEFEEKVDICEGGLEKKKEKHKLCGLDGSSSSSSSDEEDEEEKKKRMERKEKEKKKKEKLIDENAVPFENCGEEVLPPPPVAAEEKKGFLEKIKEKIPVVGAKKPEEVAHTPPPQPDFTVDTPGPPCEGGGEAEGKEKRGLLEKIKEKIPGYHHHKSHEEEKEKEIDASG